MATYDVPAMVNFVVATSGVDQVHYVGHSQGTTIGFIAFSENADVAAKIKHFIALAPVARIANTKSPIRLLAPLAKEIEVNEQKTCSHNFLFNLTHQKHNEQLNMGH